MENLDRNNFENRTFNELPETVVCSNFRKCAFNAKTTFDRCNLIACTFNVESEFHLSNVIEEDDEPKAEAAEEAAVEENKAE